MSAKLSRNVLPKPSRNVREASYTVPLTSCTKPFAPFAADRISSRIWSWIPCTDTLRCHDTMVVRHPCFETKSSQDRTLHALDVDPTSLHSSTPPSSSTFGNNNLVSYDSGLYLCSMGRSHPLSKASFGDPCRIHWLLTVLFSPPLIARMVANKNE